MKKLVIGLLMIPVISSGQVYVEPQPDTTLLSVEIKKDTLFVYRQITSPPHPMWIDQSFTKWKERDVYVIRDKSFYLLRTEKVKYRKVKIEVEEEYW